MPHACHVSAGQTNREPPKLKCIGPGADKRIAMFGRMDGYSHTISTTSSKAQQLFNQASLQLCHSMPILSVLGAGLSPDVCTGIEMPASGISSDAALSMREQGCAQGMLLAWSFNQFEAFQAFSLAAKEDPSCAMAQWGLAYSLGPGANRWFPAALVQGLSKTYHGHKQDLGSPVHVQGPHGQS